LSGRARLNGATAHRQHESTTRGTRSCFGRVVRSGRVAIWRLGPLLVLGAGLSGCQPGVRWRLGPFADGHAAASADNRLTFTYFRSWYSVECTRFEEDILKHPDVLAATVEFVCIPLEYDIDRALAERWGIDGVPAFVIVDPSGNVLERGAAPFTVAGVLATLQGALQAFHGGVAPGATP